MTVLELIKHLEQFEGCKEVHFAYNSGDHWRTTIAPVVRGVDEARVVHSDYHSVPAIVEDDDRRWDGAADVVVITATV